MCQWLTGVAPSDSLLRGCKGVSPEIEGTSEIAPDHRKGNNNEGKANENSDKA